MLYEMVSGRTPFVGEDPGEYIGQHIYGDVPPLGALVPSLTPALSRLIESMLIKEPQGRPSMAAVARVLKELGQFSSDVLPMRALLDAEPEPAAGEDKRPEPSPRDPDEDPTRSVPVKAPRQALPPPPPAPSPALAASEPKSDPAPVRSVEAVADAAPDKPAAMTDSTRLLAANVVPVPTPTPTPTPTQAPGWQTLNVVAGQEPTELRHARAPDEALDRPRPASLVRSLRRLQLRLKRLLYGVLGIPLSQPGSPGTSLPTPAAALTERRKKILLGVGVGVVLAPILALILRPATEPVEPSAEPPAEIEQRPHPERNDPSADPGGRKKGPSGALLPAGLPAEVQRGLDEAQKQAEGGSAAAAWKTLRAVVKKTDHAAAWLELGRYACGQHNPKAANEARDHLETTHDVSGAEELIGFCQKHRVVLGPDGRLLLDGPQHPGELKDE